MPKLICWVFLAVGFPMAAFSQVTQLSCSPIIGASAQSMAIMRTGVALPYSLTATIKVEMKLYDGNTISGFTTSRQAQDGQGRTRVDGPSICNTDKEQQPRWRGTVTLTDFAAKTRTAWQVDSNPTMTSARVTHISSLRAWTPRSEQQEYQEAKLVSEANEHVSPESKRHIQQTKVEDLGKRTIAGLEASGMRITRTSPPGSIGNALPLVYVEERWESDKYRVYLLDINQDPLWGTSRYEVTGFTPGEPDASLFQVPPEYKIEERP